MVEKLRKVTMRDVAKACNLSVTTVHQVLNGKKNTISISKETKKKVLAVARQMKYKVNYGYKLMHTQSTRLVAVMLSLECSIQDEHIRTMIVEIMKDFNARGYAACLHVLTQETAANIAAIRELTARGVESFIFLGSPVDSEILLETVVECECRHVAFNVSMPRRVFFDARESAARLFTFMKEKTGGNFCFFCCKSPAILALPRPQSLCSIFPELSFAEISEKYIWETPPFSSFDLHSFTREYVAQGYEQTAKLLTVRPEIRGICYHADHQALGGINCLLEKGYRIGKDILVSGFNNIETVSYLPFPVSSIEINVSATAARLVEESFKTTACDVIIPSIVHLREKC